MTQLDERGNSTENKFKYFQSSFLLLGLRKRVQKGRSRISSFNVVLSILGGKGGEGGGDMHHDVEGGGGATSTLRWKRKWGEGGKDGGGGRYLEENTIWLVRHPSSTATYFTTS